MERSGVVWRRVVLCGVSRYSCSPHIEREYTQTAMLAVEGAEEVVVATAHDHHKEPPALVFGMLLFIMVSQFLLHHWKTKHYSSFRNVTLLGVWNCSAQQLDQALGAKHFVKCKTFVVPKFTASQKIYNYSLLNCDHLLSSF